MSEVTAVVTPTNDSTPEYTFTTSEVGNMSFTGGCSTSDTISATGDATITFAALSDGTYDCNLIVTDAAGNASNILNISEFTIDATSPTYEILYSNNGPVKSGDSVTITAEFNEDVKDSSVPQIELSGDATGFDAINMTKTDSNTYTYVWTVGTGDGNLIPTVTVAEDLVGNVITETGSTKTQIEVDNTLPTLSSVTIESNNSNTAYAKVGDVVTLSFTASENLQTPTVTIAGYSVGAILSEGSYIAEYTLVSGDAEGIISFTIDFTDTAGNEGSQVTTTTNESSVTFDKTIPIISSVVLGSDEYINSDETTSGINILVNTTGVEDSQTVTCELTDGTTTISKIGSVSSNTVTIASGVLTSLNDGTITVTCDVSDISGNAATSESNTATKDTVAPTLVSAEKVSETGIELTLSETITDNDSNPTDFTVTDSQDNTFTVTSQSNTDGTTILLTVNSMHTSIGDLTVTYTNNNSEVEDLAGNDLATDSTGVVASSVNYLSFVEGWNYFALPKDTEDNTISAMFNTNLENIEVIYKYDSVNEQYVAMDNSDELELLEGYIIKTTSAFDEEVVYELDSALYSGEYRTLVPGTWNLVGNTSLENRSRMSYILNSCESTVSEDNLWDMTVHYNEAGQYGFIQNILSSYNVDLMDSFWVYVPTLPDYQSCTMLLNRLEVEE
ncbi:MAG: Ig-like domain-containing protein [Candidatus ainarchaeum sp.]|nr:Ig-like domain-containing protein [Candidatus ainarchaeum sp.]